MAAIATSLKVSVSDIKKASTRFGSLATETKKLTDNMLRLVQDTRNVWQGDAQRAYSKQFDGLRDDMQKMFKMIDEYRTDLSEVAKNYEAAENANKSAAQTLKSDVITG